MTNEPTLKTKKSYSMTFKVISRTIFIFKNFQRLEFTAFKFKYIQGAGEHCLQCFDLAFSALILLLGRQEGHRACKKTERWGVGMVICLERGADLHTAQRIPLPLTVSCFSKIQIDFTFLAPAHPGSPGQKLLNGCVCVKEPGVPWFANHCTNTVTRPVCVDTDDNFWMKWHLFYTFGILVTLSK